MKTLKRKKRTKIKKPPSSFLGKLWQKIVSFFIVRKIFIVSGFIAFIMTIVLMSILFCRTYAIGTLKNYFEELEKNLQSIGYDYAYDELSFYTFSPWQIMKAKNFRIYSLDENDFLQLTIRNFSINVGFWDIGDVRFVIGDRQSIQKGAHEWAVELDKSDIRMRLKQGEFKEFVATLQGASVKNVMNIGDVFVQVKHQRFPFLYAKADIRNVVLDDMTGWPLNKKIDHFYMDTGLQGLWDEDVLVSEAFYNWIDQGGYIEVRRGILNWKPLITVVNGEIRFNEDVEPTISLKTATSSTALLNTLDKLNENRYISNKGTFVAKLLLNNKARFYNITDKYKTVVSPLKIDKDGVTLENIKLR